MVVKSRFFEVKGETLSLGLRGNMGRGLFAVAGFLMCELCVCF